MKVLVYTSLFPNHLQPNHGIFIKQRMFHFAKLPGCEIKVVAPVPYCPAWFRFGDWHRYSQIAKYELMDGIEVYHPRYLLIPKISMPFHGLLMYFATLSMIKKIYVDFQFDIIDGHYIYPDGFAAVLLGKAIGKPVILSARGSDIHLFTNFRFIKPMIKYALNRADHIISVCNALKQEIVKLGIDSNKIVVIPNGVDTNRFQLGDKERARQQLSFAQTGKKVIVSIGSLTANKGFHFVLDALTILLRNGYKEIHLYILGEGTYRPVLEKRVKDLELSEVVTFVGQRPNSELGLWYTSADVFCLASAREGWANVIMEALACGTPVVATNVWGAPEIVTSSDIGILVERTPEQIANGIRAALETAWNRNVIRSHVEKSDWFSVADRVHYVFSSILGKNRDKKNVTTTI